MKPYLTRRKRAEGLLEKLRILARHPGSTTPYTYGLANGYARALRTVEEALDGPGRRKARHARALDDLATAVGVQRQQRPDSNTSPAYADGYLYALEHGRVLADAWLTRGGRP